MILYADTSALVKLLLEEHGSPETIRVMEEADGVTSASISYVELRAALAAAIRDGRVPTDLRDSALALLEQVWSNIAEVILDGTLLRHAGDIAERMGLRAYDAVQLAALLQVGNPGEVTFTCWDKDLSRAAQDLGYTTLP